jgi:hypothetical protein
VVVRINVLLLRICHHGSKINIISSSIYSTTRKRKVTNTIRGISTEVISTSHIYSSHISTNSMDISNSNPNLFLVTMIVNNNNNKTSARKTTPLKDTLATLPRLRRQRVAVVLAISNSDKASAFEPKHSSLPVGRHPALLK